MQREEIIVLNQYPIWVKFLHPDYRSRTNKVIGKWVHHDSPQNLAKISSSLVELILYDLTVEIKYRPILNNPSGLFSNMLPPMCIYSEPEHKDELYERIKAHGVLDPYWQSNEATRTLHSQIRGQDVTKR